MALPEKKKSGSGIIGLMRPGRRCLQSISKTFPIDKSSIGAKLSRGFRSPPGQPESIWALPLQTRIASFPSHPLHHRSFISGWTKKGKLAINRAGGKFRMPGKNRKRCSMCRPALLLVLVEAGVLTPSGNGYVFVEEKKCSILNCKETR